MCFGVDLDAVGRPGIECEPQSERSYINSLSKGIKRLDSNPVTIDFRVAAEGLPAEFRMIDDVSSRIHGNAEKVRTIIAGIGIPAHILRERMKRCAGKTFLVDIAQTAHS